MNVYTRQPWSEYCNSTKTYETSMNFAGDGVVIDKSFLSCVINLDGTPLVATPLTSGTGKREIVSIQISVTYREVKEQSE